MINSLQKMLSPLRNRIANMVSRCIIQAVNDAAGIQTAQIVCLEGETRDDVERVQQYGFSSAPVSGTEGVVVFVGGRRDHGLIVAVDDRDNRKTGLAEGEVAVYHKDGASLVMKSNGDIEVTPKSGSNIVLNGGSAKVSRVGDNTTGHTHTFTMSAGGDPVTGTINSATDSIAEGADQVLA